MKNVWIKFRYFRSEKSIQNHRIYDRKNKKNLYIVFEIELWHSFYGYKSKSDLIEDHSIQKKSY